MQLIQHDLVPQPAGPALRPLVAVRIYHLAGAMHVLRLEARGGIWNREPIGSVPAPAPGQRPRRSPGAAAAWAHGTPIGLEQHRHAIAARCPELEWDTVRLMVAP